MESPLSSRVQREGDSVVVNLSGDLDMGVGDVLPEALAIALQEASRAVIVDLSGVTFLASLGVGALIVARHDAEAKGLVFQIRNPSPIARRVLEVCGVLDTVR